MTAAPRHGPAPDEGPARRYGPVDRVAVLSDVHANIPALAAVLAEVERIDPDLVVFCGDLTWGPEPTRTVELVAALGDRGLFVRGNADRAVLDFARGGRPLERPRDSWMPGQHSTTALEFLAAVPFSVIVEVRGLGPVRFCHGSPRSDTELVTPRTPVERFAELIDGVEERVLVTGHTHVQFDRAVAGWRSINPGSVGLPYHEGEPGTAYWALLGPDVELRQTRYDQAEALARAEAAGDPSLDILTRLLTRPPSPVEVAEDAEQRVFSD
ncbi:MAG: metallophosphoesterase family protein [Micromonosporaceae bacterium]